MRRALVTELPAFCRFYGVRPWELERFTTDELHEFVTQRRDYETQIARLARQQQQRSTSRRR